MSRTPLSKRLRFDIFKRDGFECQYCGAHPPDVVLEIDHIVPVIEGGKNGIDNLVAACFDCNRGKGAERLTIIPQSLAEKSAEIQEREEQLKGYREIMDAKRDRVYDDMWIVAQALDPESLDDGLRRDWLQSIKKFLELLDFHEVLEAAEIALARKPFNKNWRFKYFCGICWNKVRAKDC